MTPLKSYIRHARAAQVSYTPDQLAALYQFPKVTGGTPQTIAIGELGGGYVLDDVQRYMSALGLPMPTITDVSVRGATNAPTGDPNGADGEVMLDVLVAAAAYSYSTGKAANIVMVWAPNDGTGIADAISAAAAHSSRPCVMSWSWGGPEDSWDSPTIAATEAALKQAAAAGMAVTAAAGDNGSGDGESGNHVDYPSSSAYVLACGGTSLQAANGVIQSETVWDDNAQSSATGGGVSSLFPVPAYQAAVLPSGVKGRGVPDWAGDADPATGYEIVIDGQTAVIGGTSAVAPLMAALVAVLCCATGKRFGAPAMHQILYANPTACRDITSGGNGGFSAGPGYDFDTGLGVPVGVKVLAAIQGAAPPIPPPVQPPPVNPPPVNPTPPPALTLAQVEAAVDAGALHGLQATLAQYGRTWLAAPASVLNRALPNVTAAINAAAASLFAGK